MPSTVIRIVWNATAYQEMLSSIYSLIMFESVSYPCVVHEGRDDGFWVKLAVRRFELVSGAKVKHFARPIDVLFGQGDPHFLRANG